MASLFHLLDEESLEKDPNLKWDPQNPSAHLNDKHPTFQELKKGLTPEQIELLEQVSSVDGYDVVDDEDEVTTIDPDTGNEIRVSDLDYSLDELGFIDPANLQSFTLEAFNNDRLIHVNNLINTRFQEIEHKKQQILNHGLIGNMEANNVNDLLGGRLYDNIVLESFTKRPTKVNYNLVMEEMQAGQAALAAGGAIIGLTILYKLVKWAINAWNGNAVASKKIGDNIDYIASKSNQIENIDSKILKPQETIKALAKSLKDSKVDDSKIKQQYEEMIQIFQQPESLSGMPNLEESVTKSILLVAMNGLTPIYCNLLNSWIFGKPSNGITVNKEYGVVTKNAVDAAVAMATLASKRVEYIISMSADKTIDDGSSNEYNQHIAAIAKWGNINGVEDGKSLNAANFAEHISNMVEMVKKNAIGVIPPNTDGSPSLFRGSNVDVFGLDTFSGVDEDFEKMTKDFYETLKEAGGDSKLLSSNKVKGNSGNIKTGSDNAQVSKANEYQRASEMFRGAMITLRCLREIRNVIGKSTTAIANGFETVVG